MSHIWRQAMKVSEKQLLILIQTLADTRDIISPDFTYSREDRRSVYQEIIIQQPEELKEIE